jgi:hypothetical protein
MLVEKWWSLGAYTSINFAIWRYNSP